jgi:hypothetical protein
MLRATAFGLRHLAGGGAVTAFVTTNEPAAGTAVDVAETDGIDAEGTTAAVTSTAQLSVANSIRPAEAERSGPEDVSGEGARPTVLRDQAT